MREEHQDQMVWYPLGEGSESRIVADLAGTAHEKTVLIEAACELHPDEALAFARQIEEAVAWLRDDLRDARSGRGMFLKGIWIEDPYALPETEFHERFCCKHWGLRHNIDRNTYICKYTGRDLAEVTNLKPIPIPAWCPKREHACADSQIRGAR